MTLVLLKAFQWYFCGHWFRLLSEKLNSVIFSSDLFLTSLLQRRTWFGSEGVLWRADHIECFMVKKAHATN